MLRFLVLRLYSLTRVQINHREPAKLFIDRRANLMHYVRISKTKSGHNAAVLYTAFSMFTFVQECHCLACVASRPQFQLLCDETCQQQEPLALQSR